MKQNLLFFSDNDQILLKQARPVYVKIRIVKVVKLFTCFDCRNQDGARERRKYAKQIQLTRCSLTFQSGVHICQATLWRRLI